MDAVGAQQRADLMGVQRGRAFAQRALQQRVGLCGIGGQGIGQYRRFP